MRPEKLNNKLQTKDAKLGVIQNNLVLDLSHSKIETNYVWIHFFIRAYFIRKNEADTGKK